MQPFNLAQTMILERSYCRHHIDRRARNIVLLLVLTMLVAGGVSSYRAIIKAKSAQIASEVKVVQAKYDTAKREIESANLITSRFAWQKQLSDQTGHLLGILGGILQGSPDDIWLSRVENTDVKSPILIEGVAPSYGSLMDFTERLRRMSVFSNVSLGSARVVTIKGADLIDFTLQVRSRSAGTDKDSDKQSQPAGVPKVGGAM